MAAVGVGTKYHCAINGMGYLLGERGYLKKDAPVFTPRFGTGDQGLNDLDLFKTWALEDFSGGSFQQTFDDITKNSLVQQLQLNNYDNLLYTVPQAVSKSTGLYANFNVGNKRAVTYKGTFYYASNQDSSNSGVYSWNPSTKAFSAVKTNFARFISDMFVFNNLLWVFLGGSSVWCYDGTTWTQDTRYGFTLGCSFRSNIVCNGYSGTSDAGKIWLRDGGVGSAGVVSLVGNVGDVNKDILSMVLYNGRVYMGKYDGLFAYDGTLISNVIDTSADGADDNFKYMAVLNGVLYYTLKNSVYKFDGANVQLVHSFAQYESLNHMTVAGGRLYVTTGVSTGYGSKFSSGNANFYYFDGVGWFLYKTVTGLTNGAGFATFYFSGGGYKHLFLCSSQVPASTYDLALYLADLGNEYLGAASETGYIYTSEFDAGFPNIDKYFDTVAVNFENMIAGDSIAVSFRTFDGKTWSSYQSLGTIDNNSTTRTLKRYETSYTGTFKKIQFQITITRGSSSTMGFKNFQMNYYLSPDQTWTWQLKLLCYGNSDTPLQLADNSTTETNSPATLRDNIYQARNTDAPVGFEDIDFNQLNGAINNSVTTITIDSTKGFRSAGYIKIDDEIIKYTGTTSTTFTGCTRAALGTSAASHTDNTVVNAYYRVTVKSIDAESVIAANQDIMGQESDLTVTLQEAPFNA